MLSQPTIPTKEFGILTKGQDIGNPEWNFLSKYLIDILNNKIGNGMAFEYSKTDFE